MMDLSTNYLGCSCARRWCVSASPLSQKSDGIRRLEDAGASAVVLYSLFEEQLRQESLELELPSHRRHRELCRVADLFPAAQRIPHRPRRLPGSHPQSQRSGQTFRSSPASTASTLGGWTKYAAQIEQAGADAIECNIYFIPTDPEADRPRVEKTYLDIVRAVRARCTIPVAVKLSPFFSNMANMAKRLDQAGADGLVLFNRFYQPDIDLEELEIKPNVLLSTPQALRLPLTWIGILLRPHQGQPGGDQRRAWSRRRDQAAHGRAPTSP